MKRIIGLLISLIIMSLAFAQADYAAEDGGQGDAVAAPRSGVVSGEVSGITKNYISIVYTRNDDTKTEYEALLPLSDAMQLNHVQSLGDLKIGDTVSVSFDESVEHDDAGKKKLVRKTKAVNFIKSALPVPEDPWIEQAKLEEKLEKEAAKAAKGK